ncbi:hypothetical protein ABTF42_01920 [Acinetobacter baumannii]
MANTKAFLIVILFAATLITSYEVSARELADPQSTRQTQSVEESKQYGYGGDGPISYGNPGGGGGGGGPISYGNPGGGSYGDPNHPPRQMKAKVVEEKRN